ncbi:MAG: cobaltochelatase subunit CobN [Methanobrevibacter sp.]|jgi:cobaltochelatase CobN|nr:cobaltochelatase subunit CobN [Candidatus Methanoflexus mossambicus]
MNNNKFKLFLTIITLIFLCFGLFNVVNATDNSNNNQNGLNSINDDVNDVNNGVGGVNDYDSDENIQNIENIENGGSGGNNGNGGSTGRSGKTAVEISVKDAYNESSRRYSEDGFNVVGGYVLVKDNNTGKIVYSGKTKGDGNLLFDLDPGNYTFNIKYSTYLEFSKNVTISGSSYKLEHIFIPDIAIIAYYTGYHVEIDSLMDISKRVYYLDIEANNKSAEEAKFWLLDYANFMYIDMYGYDSTVPASLFTSDIPAIKNFKVAYGFGIFDDENSSESNKFFGNHINLSFVGANASNNTPQTIENTYIGTYFKVAYGASNETMYILKENMKNLLDYIFYLLGETTVNPTLDLNKTPKFAQSSWGIYHPDYGRWEIKPSDELLNTWINNNPGYDGDGHGSLNWMVVEYQKWLNVSVISKELYNEFEKWYKANKPKLNNAFVVIASYYAGGSASSGAATVDALIREYESQGRAAFNIYSSEVFPSMAELLLIFSNVSNQGLASVNSLYSWSLDYENMGESNAGAIDELSQMNIEVIKAVDSISELSYKSEIGPQLEWIYGVTIPTFEGVFGAVATSYVDDYGKEHVIPGAIEKLVENTLGWVNLREKENKEKRLAVILYNYPPGKAEIGASFLDVFQSLHDLLEKLYDNGYDIGMEKSEIPNADELYTIVAEFGNKGSWAKGLLNSYVEKNWDWLNNNSLGLSQLVDLNTYLKFYKSLPTELQEELVDKWGSGIGKIMTYNESYIFIPGMLVGNIFITFQPSRGQEELDTEAYHDPKIPPHQQYITFYKWLDEIFNADAMIHMGTHGTLEWLPGRNIGLQEDDWSFELMNIPNIYPYIVSNPGEAAVAKERSAAMVISHMTPAMVITGLYGDLITLNDYIKNYESAIKNANGLEEEYKELILKFIVEHNLTTEYAISLPEENQSFDDWLEKTHLLLEDLDTTSVTLGLHSLGKILEGVELVNMTVTIVSSQTEAYNIIKNYLYSNLNNIDYYDDILHSLDYLDEKYKIQEFLIDIVTSLITGDIADFDKYDVSKDKSKFFKELLMGFINGSIPNLENYLIDKNRVDFAYFAEIIMFANMTVTNLLGSQEWEAIFNALNGEYVLPGLSADPSYSNSIPTGKNVYTTDTKKMPTKAAWESAKKIADKLMVEYYLANNKFPELVGLVMWGTELLRTEGVTMAEFLYFLGVQPKYDRTGNVIGVELIPLKDLTVKLPNGTVINRPRIDVVASAVTSNTNWIKWMVEAVSLTVFNTTDESEAVNFIKKHYNENPSLDRIFGLPGAILAGTGVSDYLPNTAKWENTININDELTSIYLSRVSNAWSIDETGRIVVRPAKSDYEYLLKNLDVVSQNIDSTWGLLDTDDYMDWFGGMLGASQNLGGNPDTAIFDIRNKNDVIARDLGEQLNFEIKSTLLNPVYKEAMFKTATGAIQYAESYEYVFGFMMVATGKNGENILSDTTLDALGFNVIGIDVTSDALSYSVQSMGGYMMELYRKNKWKTDATTIQQLADQYIKTTIDYGVACCHHTCGNIEFNKFVVRMSTLSNDLKKQYSDILQQATLGAATYEGTPGSSSDVNQGQSSSDASTSSSTSTSTSSSSDSSSNSQDSQDSSNIQGSPGQTPGEQTPSSQKPVTAQAQSEPADESNSDNSNSYELSKKSSSSSGETSMPFVAIGGVIGLLAMFGIGFFYYRRKEL